MRLWVRGLQGPVPLVNVYAGGNDDNENGLINSDHWKRPMIQRIPIILLQGCGGYVDQVNQIVFTRVEMYEPVHAFVCVNYY